ncbi:helix-turn-helix domain-containing protein [Embleya sp. NPDC005971]|uniref:helix-turn-helix domain-containing protein n=1 Tax=Embleya sp. NPDC005971 TaxID=3156724 RepID=UPI0033E20EB2
MDSLAETLRSTVAVLMHACRETQKDLALALGKDQTDVSRRQLGKRAWTLDDVDALAAHWEMPALDLLAGPTHALGCLPKRRLGATLDGTQTMIPS